MCEFVAVLLASYSVLFGLTACTTSLDQRQTGDLNVQIGLKNIQLIALLNGGSEEYVDYDYAYDYSEMTIKPQNGTTPKPLNVTNEQTNANSYSTTNANSSSTTNANSSSTPLTAYDTESNATDIRIRNNETIHSHHNETNASTSILDETKPDQITIATELVNNVDESTNNNTSSGNTITENPIIFLQNTVMFTANYNQHRTSASNIQSDLSTTFSPDVSNDSESTTSRVNHCRRGFVRNNQGKCEYKIHGPSNALRRIVKLAQKIKIGRGIKET